MQIPIIPSDRLKKEDDKLSIPLISPGQVKKVGKTTMIPIIPKSSVTEFATKHRRVPTGVKPVIPTGDTCCTKVCTIINSKVKSMENELRFREDELSSIKEGLLLETVKITVPKKGELEKSKKLGHKKIETEEVERERRVSVAYSQSRLSLKRQIDAITNQLSALKDMRFDMVEKGSCKCIEEVKFPEKEILESTVTEIKK